MSFARIPSAEHPGRRRLPTRVSSIAVLAAAALAGVSAPAHAGASSVVPRWGDFDSRAGVTTAQRSGLAQRAAQVAAGGAVQALRAALGRQGVLDIDALTGTPRQLLRLDGLLTGPSQAAPTTVVLDYVRAHSAVFRLDRTDLDHLVLRRDYVDVTGTHHLSWVQEAGGVPLFGNGLQAAVTRKGQLVEVFGSPVAGLDTAQPHGAHVARPLARGTAMAIARHDLGDTRAAAADTAHAVLFDTPAGVRRAWETITLSAAHPAVHVIDAATGQVLYRQGLDGEDDPPTATSPAPPSAASRASASVSPVVLPAPSRPSGRANPRASAADTAATGKAFDYFPSAAAGGTTHDVNYTANGWLSADATTLSGNNAHAYSDVNDDGVAQASEEVPPSSGHAWDYVLTPVTPSGFSVCGNPYPCTWDPNTPYSWTVNRAQNTAQVFDFVNTFHDHLQASPIGFTEAAGNFQQVNSTGKGKGGDAVRTETEDGANTANGLPDAYHVNSANMGTPPDGQAPTMRIYLLHQPGTSYPGGDPFAPTDVGDEADSVYHEYTHGLENRLVIDANGVSTLNGIHSAAMGEGWSDWYAMDYLVAKGLQKDTSAPGELALFQFDGAPGVKVDRTEPMDCPVGTTSATCPGTPTAGAGGYTFGDFDKVSGTNPHANGEIWEQTLWDLRNALGSTLTESLATRAMELTPAGPSFLDERNAILTADNAGYGGRDVATIWKVFAARGMGYFAAVTNGDDAAPVEDFSLPPASGSATGSLTGTVKAARTGRGIGGASVVFGGHGARVAGGYTAVTDSSGRYTINAVFAGRYPKVSTSATGYTTVVATVTVKPGRNTYNVGLATGSG